MGSGASRRTVLLLLGIAVSTTAVALLALRHDAEPMASKSSAPTNAAPVAPAPPETVCPIQFRDVTPDTGIAFQHTDGHPMATPL